MTAYRLTDAQVAKALRAQLPTAPAGLRSQILDAVVQTPQQRALPWLIGALTDADTVARRRVLLLAAAAVLALTTLVAAAVGALFDWQRRPTIPVVMPDASAPATPRPSPRAATPGDALVLDAYTGLVDLPPFRLEFMLNDGDHGPSFSYNGAGILRREHYGPPTTATIYRAGAEAWHPLSYVVTELGFDGWMCDAGWQALGQAELVGRAVQRVRCELHGAIDVTRELWIDRETGLPLRTEHWQDGELMDMLEATAFEVGPQPPGLFESGAGGTFAPPSPGLDPGVVVEPASAPDQGGVPGDLQALVERVIAGYDQRAMDLTLRPQTAAGFTTYRWTTNGMGAFFHQTFSPNLESAVIFLWATDGNIYESYPQPDGSMRWRPWGPVPPGERFLIPLEPYATCSLGWRHLGVDLVMDRPADHIACAFKEYWIDREWLIVVRAHDRDPLLDPEAGASWLTSAAFEAPAQLLEPPPTESLFSPFPSP